MMRQIAFFLALLFATLHGCGKATSPEPILSIRDKAVITWIQSHHNLAYPKALRIFLAVRGSVDTRVQNWKMRGIYQDIVLDLIDGESCYDQWAVGQFDRRSTKPGRKSRGLTQVMDDVAEIILRRKVTPQELCENVELNVDLGVRHLLSSNTLQAYNAGGRGASLGWGSHYAYKVKKTFQAMPWTIKSSNGGFNEKAFGNLFIVNFGARLGKHGHGGHRKKGRRAR